MTAAAPPLGDLLVVDLSRALAGPHAAMMLGDLGARVIKVEAPGSGDDTRGWGPPFVGPDDERESTYFLSCNRNKESICLDLKDADDLAVLTRLIGRADVLVENFRPGVMDRLGLSTTILTELNPRLVVLSISGFGHDGPEGGRAGYDQVVQGEAGLMSLTGSDTDDPQRVGVPIADLLAGIHGAYGVLAALHERSATGVGKVVRTSLLSSIVGVHAFQGTRFTVAGEVPHAQGNHHPSIAPYGLFHAADGPVQISVGSEALWRRFCSGLGLDAEDLRFATNAARVAHRAELIPVIEAVFVRRSKAELLAELERIGVPAGTVRSLDEVYQWNQVASQGLVVSVTHPTLGDISLPGPPLRFFDAAPGGETETTFRGFGPPPTLDQHSDEIRSWVLQAVPQ
ncbi:CaiB/BaiF CoA transferase family protein [Herbiconiux sp. P16]|uniref:CaiB/BaiF CoA transferase family protein n=1 Tax=Herbiconiux wuyangfengii TaxID=3342794 RepID=UPI0035BAE22B